MKKVNQNLKGCRKLVGLLAFISVLDVSWQKDTQLGRVADDYDICEYLTPGTELRKPGYCDTWIKCVDGKSEETKSKCASGKSYLLTSTTGSCGTAKDSYCNANPCKKASPIYVTDASNCEGYYQCDGSKKVKRDFCPNGLYFDENTQMCNYKELFNCEPTFEFCDVIPANVPFVDFENCGQYYTCDSSQKYKVNSCPFGTFFSIAKGTCIKKSQVKCDKYPYPPAVCGTDKLPFRNRFVPDGSSCRGYFYCKDTQAYKADAAPQWGQCPLGSFFSGDLQSCLSLVNVRCYEDRCDGIENGVTLSERYGCQHYLRCENNSTVEELACPTGQFFDANLNQCSSKFQNYPACS